MAETRIQFKILFFIICLNLATGLAIALQLPGTEYVQATDPGDGQQSPGEYEEHFNATETGEQWGASANIGIPIIGDIFAGFYFLAVNWHFLIDGFPIFLNWISDTFILDASGRLTFAILSNTLRGLYAVLMSIFFIEFISGRHLTE